MNSDVLGVDLRAALPRLLPKAIDWAAAREAEILGTGEALSVADRQKARAVGVAQLERIRLLVVDAIPMPEDSELRGVALQTGLMGPDVRGMTLGHGIYVVRGQTSPTLLAHECRHVYQYEQAGSVAAFLQIYLQQIVTYGYWDAPFEMEARAWEGVGA